LLEEKAGRKGRKGKRKDAKKEKRKENDKNKSNTKEKNLKLDRFGPDLSFSIALNIFLFRSRLLLQLSLLLPSRPFSFLCVLCVPL
jgi:hypothetical protein